VAEPRLYAQPDRRSCGAAVLVAARALVDPPYAALVADPARFRGEVLGMHRRVTGPVGLDGRLQLPWPRAIGTPPWAVARQLTATLGTPYRTARADHDRIARATVDGPVAIYIGNRWLPRHVVLATSSHHDVLRVYEPASGRWVDLRRGPVRLAGWDRLWFSVLPRARRTPA
jgi:hypothetical protein